MARTRSETLTAAAQELSARRKALREVLGLGGEWNESILSRVRGLQADVVDAQMAYSAAYVAYTNPFGVESERDL